MKNATCPPLLASSEPAGSGLSLPPETFTTHLPAITSYIHDSGEVSTVTSYIIGKNATCPSIPATTGFHIPSFGTAVQTVTTQLPAMTSYVYRSFSDHNSGNVVTITITESESAVCGGNVSRAITAGLGTSAATSKVVSSFSAESCASVSTVTSYILATTMERHDTASWPLTASDSIRPRSLEASDGITGSSPGGVTVTSYVELQNASCATTLHGATSFIYRDGCSSCSTSAAAEGITSSSLPSAQNSSCLTALPAQAPGSTVTSYIYGPNNGNHSAAGSFNIRTSTLTVTSLIYGSNDMSYSAAASAVVRTSTLTVTASLYGADNSSSICPTAVPSPVPGSTVTSYIYGANYSGRSVAMSPNLQSSGLTVTSYIYGTDSSSCAPVSSFGSRVITS